MTGLVVQCFGGPCDGQLVEFVNCRPYPVYEFPMAVELSYQSMVLTPPPLGQPGKRAFYKLRVKNGILRYEYVETR